VNHPDERFRSPSAGAKLCGKPADAFR
jgi:hypothetical protein